MKEIVLSAGHIKIGILPELGGSLSFLTYRDQHILRPIDLSKEQADAIHSAMFFMLPYCGRIRGGSFTYWGVLRKVAKNHLGFTDPIHGDGWKAKWQIIHQDETSLIIALDHKKDKGGFPFNYQSQITYSVSEKGLHIKIDVTNPGPLPMPCGLGAHPFFLREKDVLLDFKTQVVWSNESDPIFGQPYATPETWQFDGGKPLMNAVFDTCFGGFEENAKVTYPDKGITIHMQTNDLFHHVVLYAPKGKNFFSLEPTTCATNAFNLAAEGVIGTGIRSIGPAQTMTGEIRFNIQG